MIKKLLWAVTAELDTSLTRSLCYKTAWERCWGKLLVLPDTDYCALQKPASGEAGPTAGAGLWRSHVWCRNLPRGAHDPGRKTSFSCNVTYRALQIKLNIMTAGIGKYLKGPHPFLQSRQWRVYLELRGSKWTTDMFGQTSNFIFYYYWCLLMDLI